MYVDGRERRRRRADRQPGAPSAPGRVRPHHHLTDAPGRGRSARPPRARGPLPHRLRLARLRRSPCDKRSPVRWRPRCAVAVALVATVAWRTCRGAAGAADQGAGLLQDRRLPPLRPSPTASPRSSSSAPPTASPSTATEDATQFTTANLAQFQAVIWLSTTGDVLNATQQTAFQSYIAAGGGYVGVHAAADTEYDWPWYGGLVGAYFPSPPGHPDTRHVRVEDRGQRLHRAPAGDLDAHRRVVQLPHQPAAQRPRADEPQRGAATPAAPWATTRSPGARTTAAAGPGTPASATPRRATPTPTSPACCSAASRSRPARCAADCSPAATPPARRDQPAGPGQQQVRHRPQRRRGRADRQRHRGRHRRAVRADRPGQRQHRAARPGQRALRVRGQRGRDPADRQPDRDRRLGDLRADPQLQRHGQPAGPGEREVRRRRERRRGGADRQPHRDRPVGAVRPGRGADAVRRPIDGALALLVALGSAPSRRVASRAPDPRSPRPPTPSSRARVFTANSG